MNNPPLVLVVEDNEANQLLTRAVLEREGFEVDVAGAPDEAFEKLARRLPSLILMDIQLPGEDGLSLSRRLKAGPATANIPIIALTAHAMPGDGQATIDAGCVGYITKPIDTTAFGDQIRELLAPADGLSAPPKLGSRQN